jgi:hypothetical protein
LVIWGALPEIGRSGENDFLPSRLNFLPPLLALGSGLLQGGDVGLAGLDCTALVRLGVRAFTRHMRSLLSLNIDIMRARIAFCRAASAVIPTALASSVWVSEFSAIAAPYRLSIRATTS